MNLSAFFSFAALLVVGIVVVLVASSAVSSSPIPHELKLKSNNIPGCGGKGPNKYPIITAAPTLMRSCPNGKLFLGGDASLNQSFYILHVWGNATQQGTAYGTLLAKEIPESIQNMFEYVESMIMKSVPSLPAWIVDLVVTKGVPYLLDMTWNATLPWIPREYIDEIDAIAVGASGPNAAPADVAKLQRLLRGLSVFPEAIEAQCTIAAAYGKATPDNHLAHARLLDFGDAKIKDLPLVTVYHNDDAHINDELTYGWVGFVGVLTGAARVKATNTVFSLGEKVWDAGSIWTAGIFGEPWTMMTRDVLRRSSTISDSIRILATGQRTCRIWLGIGHQAHIDHSEFRIFSVDKDVFDVYTWRNFSEWPGHPTLPEVYYVNKDMQPSTNPCLGLLLKDLYGNITAELLATHVASYEQSGDIHAATFDDFAQLSFFSIMKKSFDKGSMPVNSYDRPWTKLDMAALWAEPAPSQ